MIKIGAKIGSRNSGEAFVNTLSQKWKSTGYAVVSSYQYILIFVDTVCICTWDKSYQHAYRFTNKSETVTNSPERLYSRYIRHLESYWVSSTFRTFPSYSVHQHGNSYIPQARIRKVSPAPPQTQCAATYVRQNFSNPWVPITSLRNYEAVLNHLLSSAWCMCA